MMVTISIVAAMDLSRCIGNDGKLPWHLPADLKHFHELTIGKPVIMGRKTFESLDKPLEGRLNIVMTRNQKFEAPGCLIVHSVEEVVGITSRYKEIMIIGGAAIYDEFLDRADRIHLSIVHEHFPGDVYFPNFDRSQWKEISRQERRADHKNPHDISFITLERKKS